MITFRARPEGSIDWTELNVSGEDEDAAARVVATALAERSWEILQSRDHRPFCGLDDDEGFFDE